MLKTSSFDRLIRKVVPSLSMITYNRFFAEGIDALEFLPRQFYPEFKAIPPNHLRVRVGVSNRVFSNASHYKTAATNFWMYCLAEGIISWDSTIVDIGVGCGRFAHLLRDLDFLGKRFSGTYYGIDIDEELLAWCRNNFDSERFKFFHSTHQSKSYLNKSGSDGFVELPLEADTADLVFSTSLYSHLLEPEARNYTSEAFRVLKPGGTSMMSVFCLDYPPPTYGNRHTFSHKMGNAYVESLAQPEAAVAYEEKFLVSMCREVGFSESEIRTAPGLWQPRLTSVK